MIGYVEAVTIMFTVGFIYIVNLIPARTNSCRMVAVMMLFPLWILLAVLFHWTFPIILIIGTEIIIEYSKRTATGANHYLLLCDNPVIAAQLVKHPSVTAGVYADLIKDGKIT